MRVTVVGLEVLQALLSDPKWAERLNKVKNAAEYEEVLRKFCSSHGIEVVEVSVAA